MTPHLKALCHLAMRQSFYVVVFHPRGTAGCPMTTARLTEFGDADDLQQAVAYVHSRHPSSVLVAVSEDSGSGILLSYFGECGSSSYLTATAAISPVLLGQRWFETAMPPIYHSGALFRRKLQLSRYGSSFRPVLDVDRALSCSSHRDFEETVFCSSTQHQQRAPKSPISSLNSGLSSGSSSPQVTLSGLGTGRDEPLLPPASTLPLPLFQSNPYFLLVLTDSGGHCGFNLEAREDSEGGRTGNEEVEESNWSHMAVLEYFRVVADFLKGEERDGPAGGQRSRTSNMALPRKRRATMMRRPKPQVPEQSCVEEKEGDFTWKRSYTR
ncbi:hypothetical protein PAMP_007104 [Pampus punctatissimus]